MTDLFNTLAEALRPPKFKETLHYNDKNIVMNIIRDEEMFGMMMIPLLISWGVKRCNVRDCKDKPTTIITGLIKQPFGLCEKHYIESKEIGKLAYTLDFCEV